MQQIINKVDPKVRERLLRCIRLLCDNMLLWAVPCFELIFHIWMKLSFTAGQLLAFTGYGLFLGALLCALGRCLSGKAEKIYVTVITALMAVMFLAQFFLYDAFRAFMNPRQIFAGAGGVMGGFMDVVATQIWGNLWRIAIMLLPAAMYLWKGEPNKGKFQPKRVLQAGVLCAIGLLVGLMGTALEPEGLSALGSNYAYSTCVERLGVSAGLVMELSGQGQRAALSSLTEEEEPPASETIPEEVEEETVEYGEHTMAALDVETLSKIAPNKGFRELFSYMAAREPAKKNEYTGLFKGKNLILITAEAFTTQVIDPVRTPTLYRLANNGIRFTDYYQPLWNGSTTSGELSIISGLVPELSGSMQNYAINKPFNTMGWQLRNLNYFSRCYHNNDCSFYNRNTTHERLGYEKFIAIFNGMEKGVKNIWPQSDHEMIDFTVPQYIDKQPFSIYYITVSGHSTYTYNSHAQARKNWDLVKDMDCSDPIKCYYAANMELEKAMASLVKQLEEAGIADDTVIALSADHYPYGLDNGTAWGNHGTNMLDEFYGVRNCDIFTRDHNSLIIWSGSIEGQGITVDTPTCALDILPTLSNLFDLDYDSRLTVGRDALGTEEAIVLWPNHSWVTELGHYDASTRVFTPNAGAKIPVGYEERIHKIVTNKINFSHSMQTSGILGYMTKLVQEYRNAQLSQP